MKKNKKIKNQSIYVILIFIVALSILAYARANIIVKYGSTSLDNSKNQYKEELAGGTNNINSSQNTMAISKEKAEIKVPQVATTYNPNSKLSSFKLGDADGEWIWKNPDTVPTVDVPSYEATYSPYDWNKYDYTGVELTHMINIKISQATPSYYLPELVAHKYDTLANIEFPKQSLGKFSWQTNSNKQLNELGTFEFLVTFTPNDTVNYRTLTDITATVKVEKAIPTYTIPTGLTATYGNKLSDVPLTHGFTWNTPDILVGNVGNRTFMATYTPNDPESYQTITDIKISITIKKAVPTYTVPTTLTATYGDKLSSVSLPHGFTWNTPDVLVGNVGNRTFTATYTPDDPNNYETIENISINVTVKKAKGTIVLPTFEEMEYDPNRHLSDLELPDNWNWDDPDTVPTVINNGYKATFKPKDTENFDYSGQNLSPNLELKILKADPEYTLPDDITFSWDSDLKDVKLPDGFSWEEEEQERTIGTNTLKVTYTPEDSDNYNIIQNIPINVDIVKATLDVEEPSDITVQEKEGQVLGDIQLPEGWRWVNPETTLSESGKYLAVYEPADLEHYNTIEKEISINVLPTPEKNTENTASPNTGDNLIIYLITLSVSLILIIGVLVYKLKSKKTNNK